MKKFEIKKIFNSFFHPKMTKFESITSLFGVFFLLVSPLFGVVAFDSLNILGSILLIIFAPTVIFYIYKKGKLFESNSGQSHSFKVTTVTLIIPFAILFLFLEGQTEQNNSPSVTKVYLSNERTYYNQKLGRAVRVCVYENGEELQVVAELQCISPLNR